MRNLSLLHHPKLILAAAAAAASFSHVNRFSSSSATTQTQNPPPKSIISIAQYLVCSCGLSSQKAVTASKRIPKFTSVDQANSVRYFFKQLGFTDESIRKLIPRYPRILCADVERTLRPNLQSLRDMGFTVAELELLISSNSYVLVCPMAIPRLKFWQTFLRTDSNKELVSVFTRNRGLICHDIASGIAPKISLLKKHGLSEMDIIGIVKRGQGFIERSPKAMEALLKRAKEFGFDPKTPMFGQALSFLSSISSNALVAKMEFLQGFGWSDKELLSAVKKAPVIFRLSEENILRKMEFLVGRAGCQPSYIASNPTLLTFSLEKRLKPRYHIMEILKSNEIVGKWGIYYIMRLPEKKFVETIILPHKEEVPNIHEIYIAACSGEIQF